MMLLAWLALGSVLDAAYQGVASVAAVDSSSGSSLVDDDCIVVDRAG